MIEIIPAILTDSSVRLKELILKLEPYTRRVHIDIADGVFVPNKTINGYGEIKEIESALKFDVHLMTAQPEKYLKEWMYTQADRFLMHVESEFDIEKIIDQMHKNNRKVGLVLNPETSVDELKPFMDKIDLIQFMTVHPGFQGGEFVKNVVDKIASFHQQYSDIIIMCDGGITSETAPDLVKAGVSILVSGSYIIKSADAGKAIKELEASIRY